MEPENSGAKRKSRRTQDVCKNVVILLVQFYTLCQIDGFAQNIEDNHVR
jgi:hypothetical protein